MCKIADFIADNLPRIAGIVMALTFVGGLIAVVAHNSAGLWAVAVAGIIVLLCFVILACWKETSERSG